MDIKFDDTNNDIVIENNNIAFVAGLEEIRQLHLERLRLFKGEWFLDLQKGVPYFQSILGKGNRIEDIATIFKNEILSIPGTRSLSKFDLDFDASTRNLTLDYTAVTEGNEFVRISEVYNA
jgi:hypothetical protein